MKCPNCNKDMDSTLVECPHCRYDRVLETAPTSGKHKYLVTYEASLKAGGWTHSEVTVTAEKLNAAVLDSAREWVRSNRTDITESVCVMNVVKLDE